MPITNTLAPAGRPAPPPSTDAPQPHHRGILIVLCGVVLPLITTVVELATHMCADAFFDPLPTLGHVFAVFLVPLAAMASLRALWRRDGQRLEATMFAQACATAIAGAYALMFAPLTPLALIAVPYMGMGILPLAPALSMFAGVRALFALRRLRIALGRPPRRRLLGAGFAAGVGLMLALQIPATATRILVAAAASNDADTSRTGVRWLRRVGSRDLMLRACHQRPSNPTDIVGALINVAIPVPPEKMRDIYYRVTGRPFDTEPQPFLGGPLAGGRAGGRDWDIEQGSERVGVVAMRGLTLAGSRLDGTVDARAAVGYVEWTFEFANASPTEREARAEIVLPPGGVVSRVTLWIDGIEHEATFAGRDVTRRAYERVVRRRRDPVLVTTTAPDRVLVQCFPVPPNGGRMKTRIGITAPLQLATRAAGTLILPYFAQRNFSVPASVKHAILVDSKDRFLTQAAPMVAEPDSPAPFAHVTVERPAGTPDIAWAPDRTPAGPASPAAIVRQTLRTQPIPAPSRLVIVIDGSAAMADAAAPIAAALAAIPSAVPVALTIAGDDIVDYASPAAAFAGADFAGGSDSLPALVAAWDVAAAQPGSVVLWIHGPQPMLLASPEPLRQRIERRRDGPPIYAFAAVGGENLVLTSLSDVAGAHIVPRSSAGAEGLHAFLRTLDGSSARIVADRAREAGAAAPASGAQTSDHLARLWARDRIAELLRGVAGRPPTPGQRQEALALAGRYHLVTPVSGAVVLESQAQYDEAGLTPADGSQVPTVPEPGTWALILSLALALVLARRRMLGARRAM